MRLVIGYRRYEQEERRRLEKINAELRDGLASAKRERDEEAERMRTLANRIESLQSARDQQAAAFEKQATELRDLRTAEFAKAAESEKRLRQVRSSKARKAKRARARARSRARTLAQATEGKHELERALRRKEAELERVLAGRYALSLAPLFASARAFD